MKVLTFHLWMVTDSESKVGRMTEKLLYLLGAASRWVAVDAVVEALFVGMLLKIPSVKAEHRIAFLAFVMYCIISNVAFLLVSPRNQVTLQTSALGRAGKRAPGLILVVAALF